MMTAEKESQGHPCKPITASSVELDFLAAKRGELVKEFKETVKSARRVVREKGNL